MSIVFEEEWDYVFSWRVDNFSSCASEIGGELRSPTFTIESIRNTKWHLSIYPRGENMDEERCFVTYLRKNNDSASCHIICKIEILNYDGNILKNRVAHYPLGCGEDKAVLVVMNNHDLLSIIKYRIVDALIVRCSFKEAVRSKGQLVKCCARTRIIPEKCIFEWRLNFSLLKDLFLKDKNYFLLESILYEISISIPQDKVVFRIRNITQVSSSSCITGKITLLNVKGIEDFTTEDTHVFNSLLEKEIWEFPPFISKQALQDRYNELVEDGTIVLLCEFFAFRETGWRSAMNTKRASVSFVENLLDLREDFQKLLSDGNRSDAVLRVNNGELQAHRTVLAARSSVFSAMFDKEMLENRTGIVEIPDVDLNTLKSFLKFIYTGSAEEMDFDAACKLLMVAEKYQLFSLKEVCAVYLQCNFDATNVCEVLVLADLVHHKALKAASLEFAAEHFLEIFPSTEQSDWIKENMQLFSELLPLLNKYLQVNPNTKLRGSDGNPDK